MLDTVKREVTQVTMQVQVKNEADVEAVEKPTELENVQYQHTDFDEALAPTGEVGSFEREGVKVGRNDPCPCGSGQKFKQCHGKLS